MWQTDQTSSLSHPPLSLLPPWLHATLLSSDNSSRFVSCQLSVVTDRNLLSHLSSLYGDEDMRGWEAERLRGWEATQLDFNFSFDFRALRSVMDCPTSPTYEGRLGGSHSHYCHSRSSTSSTSSSSSKCSMEVRGYGKVTSPSPALNSTGSSVRHSSTSSTESNPARCYCREDPR